MFHDISKRNDLTYKISTREWTLSRQLLSYFLTVENNSSVYY